jgi:hypothetical protein
MTDGKSSQRTAQSLHSITVAAIVAAIRCPETSDVIDEQMAKRRSGIRNHATVEGYDVQ